MKGLFQCPPRALALGIHVPTPGALKGQKLYMAPRTSCFAPSIHPRTDYGSTAT